MKLWTWQHPDWDITSQKWSDAHGAEMWGDRVWTRERLPLLYEELRGKLSMTAFIWCFTHYVHWDSSRICRLWELNVPDDRVRLIDDLAWKDLREKNFNNEMTEADVWRKLLSPGPSSEVTALVEVPVDNEWVIDGAHFNKGTAAGGRLPEDLPTSIEEAQECRCFKDQKW